MHRGTQSSANESPIEAAANCLSSVACSVCVHLCAALVQINLPAGTTLYFSPERVEQGSFFGFAADIW